MQPGHLRLRNSPAHTVQPKGACALSDTMTDIWWNGMDRCRNPIQLPCQGISVIPAAIPMQYFHPVSFRISLIPCASFFLSCDLILLAAVLWIVSVSITVFPFLCFTAGCTFSGSRKRSGSGCWKTCLFRQIRLWTPWMAYF